MASCKKLDSFAKLFSDNIFAPVITAVQPNDTARSMSVCADGEIRHYGHKNINGKEYRVYLASRDMGFNWNMFPADPKDPGCAMVKCPWADYWLGFDVMKREICISAKGPGFTPDKTIKLSPEFDNMENRPPLPLRSRKRWIIPFSNVACLNGTCYHAACGYSDDDGKTWTLVHIPVVPDVKRKFACDKRPHWFNNGCEPSVAELADGTLVMLLRTSGEYMAITRSHDGGETWEVPKPHPGFWQANTMPELRTLKDGRLLMIWNNTVMLPTRDPAETPELGEAELSGQWEAVFTNRDALHAAISEDQGKTWTGFREILLNEIRNDSDFRQAGVEEGDKSVHQTQTIELPNGKILVAAGQNSAARKIVIFDPAWLYEKSRTETFQNGLARISHHLYVKSLSGGFRGWAGHCAWNRVPGVVLARDPENSNRESLWLCRVNDPRLVSTRSGFVWNYPASQKGKLEIEFRIEGKGFRVSLQDHWSNPCDEYLVPRSFCVFDAEPKTFAPRSEWATLTVEWDLKKGKAVFQCGANKAVVPLKKTGFQKSGPSYLHIQTLAENADAKGVFFRELRMTKLD